MNAVERAISLVSPAWAVRRQRARHVLAFYEAVKPGTLRRRRTKDGSGDMAAAFGNAAGLRAYARDLERNHDIARGAINRLVQNIIGPNGIQIEPQPRARDGAIHEDFARAILGLWRNWCKRPEVTWQHDWPSAQRLLCRAWVRDGEALAQNVVGTSGGLDHGTDVPYSIEMLESDFLPLEFYDQGRGIVQGVERSPWGRPLAYWLYKNDPALLYKLVTFNDLKRVPADRMLHVKLVDRMQQARGISVFASVLTRLDDIKDYEESERIAAKVAASMAAYIKKGVPDDYKPELDDNGDPIRRSLKLRPGMIFDDLSPGEEIGTIDSKRPNPEVEHFRQGQLRAAAAGADVSYSSLARDYNGTFSAQRQELVEQWAAYSVLADEFGARVVQPVYETFLTAAISARLLKLPADLDPATLDDTIQIPTQMPWIDPEKEANAWAMLEDRGYASAPEIIRRRGLTPRDVLEQQANWQQLVKDKGVMLNKTAAAKPAPALVQQQN